MFQKCLNKGGFNFSYDDTLDWEKESSVNKRIKNITIQFKMNGIVGYGSRVVVTHQQKNKKIEY